MTRLFTLLVFPRITFNYQAQEPQLFESTWYIHKLTINNTDYFPPNSEPIPYDETDFIENPPQLNTGYCDLFGMDIIFDTNEATFDVIDIVELGGSCFQNENFEFSTNYYSFFDDINGFNNSFMYEIMGSGSTNSLLITNGNGDTALYGDEVLAINDIEKLTITLFPIPSHDQLTITSNSNFIENISIFTIPDQEVMRLKFQQNNTTLNTSGLQAGVYFLQAERGTGQQLTAKFVKE